MTKRTKSFGDVIRNKLVRDPDLQERVNREQVNIDVATQIYNARKRESLTQSQLARRVGTSQSVIARMEDADYDGHSLRLLTRIANALDCRLGVDFYKRPTPLPETARVQSHTITINWPEPVTSSEVIDFNVE